MSGELFQATMRELAAVYDGDRKVYILTARGHIQNLANLFKTDAARREGDRDADSGREGLSRVPPEEAEQPNGT